MTATLVELNHQFQTRERPAGRFDSFIDFIVDEVKSVIAGEPSARDLQKVRGEIGRYVWGAVGPLLTVRGGAWDDHLASVAASSEFLRFMDRMSSGDRAISKVREEAQKALAVRQLRPLSPGQQKAEVLQARLLAFFDALDRHIRLRKPRMPADSRVMPALTRVYATFTAVVVAGEVGNFDDVLVERCVHASLRACSDFGRFFGLRSLPAVDEERQQLAARAADATQLRHVMLQQASADDEYAEMGD